MIILAILLWAIAVWQITGFVNLCAHEGRRSVIFVNLAITLVVCATLVLAGLALTR